MSWGRFIASRYGLSCKVRAFCSNKPAARSAFSALNALPSSNAFAASTGQGGTTGRGVAHRCELAASQRVHLGPVVAGHRQFHHEHRAVPARLDRAFDGAQADDRQLAGGGAHHNVEFVQAAGQI